MLASVYVPRQGRDLEVRRSRWTAATCSTTRSCPQSTTASPTPLSWDELATVLRLAIESRRAIGIEVTIFKPALDGDGAIAGSLVDCLVGALGPGPASEEEGP